MGHSGEKAEAYSRGLQFVFERPSLEINPVILNKYAGEYQLAPGVNIKLTVEKKHLVLNTPDGMSRTLHAASETEFYLKGTYAVARFKKDKDGKVTGFELEQYTGKNFVKKVGN